MSFSLCRLPKARHMNPDGYFTMRSKTGSAGPALASLGFSYDATPARHVVCRGESGSA